MSEAIQQRQREGPCFRYPAKYYPSHSCSPPQFMFIVDQGDSAPTEPPPTTPEPLLQSPELMSLSPAAFYGMSFPQTLRLTGFVLGKPVTILIDCGSTHNIMQPRITTTLRLPTLPLPPFPVMVGNGQHIQCEGQCPDVPLTLQDAPFTIPFFLFQIHGADIVLGISRLESLWTIRASISVPELSFTISGTTTTLCGNALTQPVSPESLASMIRHDNVASLHTLTLQEATTHCPAPLPCVRPTSFPPSSFLSGFISCSTHPSAKSSP